MQKKQKVLLWLGVSAALAILLVGPGLWWFSPTQQQHRRNKALVAACTAGDVKACLDAQAGGADANATDEIGITALMYAARGHHPNMSNPAATDHPDVVQLLLKSGANVNATTDSGFVALFWAARYGHEQVVKVLIDNGANVNAKDKDGMTAMKWADTNRTASPLNYDKVITLLKDAEAKR